MNNCKNKTFSQRIKLRIRLLWASLALMLVYMVVVTELGLGDSRVMTQLAQIASRVIFFGGFVTIIIRIVRSKKLLADKALLAEKQRETADEREQFLHDKSGGLVTDILLLVLLFVTCTAALWNMPAFYVSLGILAVTVLLKAGCRIVYSKLY